MGFLNMDEADDITPGKLLRRGFIMLNPKCCVFKDTFHTWVVRSSSLPLLSTLPFCLFASYSLWECRHDGQPPQSQFIARNVCLKSFDMLDARGRMGGARGRRGLLRLHPPWTSSCSMESHSYWTKTLRTSKESGSSCWSAQGWA